MQIGPIQINKRFFGGLALGGVVGALGYLAWRKWGPNQSTPPAPPAG